jgi:hypothetical protein
MAADDGRTRRWWGLPASLLVVAAIGIVYTTTVTNSPGGNTSAPANLEIALTGAKTYYNASGYTFLGLTHPESSTLSSIQEIVGGLSFVSGGDSTATRVISTDVGGDGSYLVLAAYSTGVHDCWGILDVTGQHPTTLLGIRVGKSPDTYFFIIRNTVPSRCNAARMRSVSPYSTTGFPYG